MIAAALIDLCYFHCFACARLGLVDLTLRNAPIRDRLLWLLGLLVFSFFFPALKSLGSFLVELREETSSLSLKLFNGKKEHFWIFHRAAGPAARVWEEVMHIYLPSIT